MHGIFKASFLLFFLILIFNISGCATAISISTAEKETQCGSDCNVPRIYSGSAVDICGLTVDNLAIFALIDLPLSVVADTLLLPYTIYTHNKYGYISVKDSCGSNKYASKSPTGLEVKENKIYVKGVLYAELLFVYPYHKRCRGIAIHYMPEDSYAWVSPHGGLQLQERQTGKIIEDIPRIVKMWDQFEPQYRILKNSESEGGDGYFKMDWRSDVKISDDGLFVNYTEQTESILGATKKTYRIRY